MLSKNPLKTLRFVNVLQKNYKKTDSSLTNGYHFFINAVRAYSYFSLNKTGELVEIYDGFTLSYKSDKNSFTDYMKTVYFGLRIRVNIRLNKHTHLIEDMKIFRQVAAEHRLSVLYTLAVILDCADIAELYPQFYKQCQYDYTRFVRECSLPPDVFLNKIPLAQ